MLKRGTFFNAKVAHVGEAALLLIQVGLALEQTALRRVGKVARRFFFNPAGVNKTEWFQ